MIITMMTMMAMVMSIAVVELSKQDLLERVPKVWIKNCVNNRIE
jgi:hypothetical protein